jgi:predicted nucleic acid-binding protein
MIVLDTNVVSELYRPGGAHNVVAWASAQPRTALFAPSPVMGEIRFGVVQLSAGRRRDDLAKRYAAIRNVFRSNILVFDLRAAEAFADIVAERRRAGAPISIIDAQIAAIAKSRNAALATRDVRDFAGCGVTLIDPWAFAG